MVVGMVVLIVLLGVGLALFQAPFEFSRLRLAGVNLLWWYTLVVAPLVAMLVAAPLLRRRSD
jgi:hypothetical protein